jgi:uncharacterized membrane protein
MKTILLALHLMAVATGTGMSIANYVNIRIAAGEKGDRRASLVYLRRVLARFGDVVIAAVFATGIALYFAEPPQGEMNGWFVALLLSSAALLICHAAARMTARKMLASNDDTLYPRMEMLVSGVWLSALASILFAVLAFET